MESELTYQLFTISDLRDFVMHNAQNGITPEMISPIRAYALINNPCAKDTDVVLSTIKQDDKTVGYTAVFAEELVKPQLGTRIFWGSTEWVDQSMRGKGVAAQMMQNIKDAVNGKYFGLESSAASVKLDVRQGSQVHYFSKYIYKFRASQASLKAKLFNTYVEICNGKLKRKLDNLPFEVQYVNYIDDLTYDFITAHSAEDLFLRQQSMFNWMLQYPFVMPNYANNHEKKSTCAFGDNTNENRVYGLRVLLENVLAGVAIINIIDQRATLRYLYFEPQQQHEVFSAVLFAIFQHDIHELAFTNATFNEYLLSIDLKKTNRKNYITPLSFTYPANFEFDKANTLQAGDGDMFC